MKYPFFISCICRHVLLVILFLLTYHVGYAQANKSELIYLEIDKLFNDGRYEDVIVFADKALIKDSKNCKLILLKGRAQGYLERYDEGLKTISKAIEYCPLNADGHFYRSLTYSLLKDFAHALIDIERAIKLEPGNTEFLKTGGTLNIRLEDYEKAIIYFDKVLLADPTNYECLVFRGRSKKKLKRYKEALLDYNEAIKINRDAAFAYEERGFLYLETKEFEKAVYDFKFIVDHSDIDKSDVLYAFSYNNLGFAQFKNKQYHEALKNIDHSLILFQTNSYAYKNRALILFQLEDKISACSDLYKAKELGYSKNYGNEVDELISQNCSSK